jgi:hypothetical protein|tara:strand:+ start:1410 stop:1646 length:237 start_codon:yes stop_codon:yes gene_type:complete
MRTYIIINITEVGLVNFNEVLETSQSTLRTKCDGSQAVLKWEGSEPSFVASLSSYDGPYTHSEILSIMATTAWICDPI